MQVVSSSGRAAAALHHAARSQVEGGRMEDGLGEKGAGFGDSE